MTDSDIVKAFESLFKKLLNVKYELKITRKELLALNRVDTLIKRQQEEIERLEVELKAMRGAANSYKMHYNNAIKEFAERLKSRTRQMTEYDEGGWDCTRYAIDDEGIDNLVKEMMEEQE